MEDWPTDLFKMLEKLAGEVVEEVDQYLFEVGEEVNEMVDMFFEIPESILRVSEELTEELQNTIISELDQFFDEIVDPFFEFYIGIEEVAEEPDPFVTHVEPTPEKNSACIGCKNYHGYVYGGNLMVCGMHPYGWDAGDCPDWESK